MCVNRVATQILIWDNLISGFGLAIAYTFVYICVFRWKKKCFCSRQENDKRHYLIIDIRENNATISLESKSCMT